MGSLTKISAGTLTLSGTNTNSGNVAVNGGVLSVAGSSNIGDGSATNNLSIDGGTLTVTSTFATSRTLTVGSNSGNGTIDVTGANTFTLSSPTAASAGALTKIDTGTLVLTGTQGHTGATNVNGRFVARDTDIGGVRCMANAGIVFPGAAPRIASNQTGYTALNANEVITGTNATFSFGAIYGAVITTLNTDATGVHTSVLNLSGSATVPPGALLDVGVMTGTYYGSNVVLITSATPNITSPFTLAVSLPSGWSTLYTTGGPNGTPVNPAVTPADTVMIVTTNSSVTPVTVASFSAKIDGVGVLLAWDAVSEFKNAGFNLYRRTPGGNDDWTRVNSALVSGRITNPDLKTYRYFDWAQPGDILNTNSKRSGHTRRTREVSRSWPVRSRSMAAALRQRTPGLTAVRLRTSELKSMPSGRPN